RLTPVSRLNDLVSIRAQRLTSYFPDHLLVFDDQSGLRTSRTLRLSSLLLCLGDRLLNARQVNRKGCAMAGVAVDYNRAAALLDDAVHGRQSQPSASPLFFGGEEGLENLGKCLCIHAASGVADGQHDVGAGWEQEVLLRI